MHFPATFVDHAHNQRVRDRTFHLRSAHARVQARVHEVRMHKAGQESNAKLQRHRVWNEDGNGKRPSSPVHMSHAASCYPSFPCASEFPANTARAIVCLSFGRPVQKQNTHDVCMQDMSMYSNAVNVAAQTTRKTRHSCACKRKQTWPPSVVHDLCNSRRIRCNRWNSCLSNHSLANFMLVLNQRRSFCELLSADKVVS